MFRALAVMAVLAAPMAFANDQYHVYKLSNGECEIDTRSHDQFKSARGSSDCKGHDDYRTDAMKIRAQKVKAGECKCPSGQSCT